MKTYLKPDSLLHMCIGAVIVFGLASLLTTLVILFHSAGRIPFRDRGDCVHFLDLEKPAAFLGGQQ